MVFLFPGVLFRKFYFSGQFGNQFEQGNLLERFLWSLFLSFISLSFVAIIFYSIGYFFDLHPLESIDFKKVSTIFKSLSKNEFPNAFTDKIEFINFLILIFIIYFISASLGFIVHKIIRLFSFDRFSIFKFKNKWHYLSQAYKENGVNRKIGDVYITLVDVLVNNNSKDELYTGILNNFIIDKDDKLENIVISNAYKFVSIDKTEQEKIAAIEKSIEDGENIFTLHRDYLNKKVYRKSIDGNLLVLSNENIININFTYVKTSNKVKTWKRYFHSSLILIYLLGVLGLVILPFLQLKISYFDKIVPKIIFSITTILIASVLLNISGELLKIKNQDSDTSYKDSFFIILLFSTPYLWIFNISSLPWTFFIFFIVFLIFGALQNNDKS